MPGIMEEFGNLVNPENASLEGSAVLESEIVLAAIRESCGSDEEFAELIGDTATEMALYDVISDAELATEAAKRIVITDFRAANFNRIEKRTAIRLAMINNDPLFAKYKKFRELFLDVRAKIYKKYGNKAKVEAKRIIKNARRKASNMPSPGGKSVMDKIDRQIEKATTSVADKN